MSGRDALAFEEALTTLQGFESLPDNWDHDGARVVNADVCKRAAHFLKTARNQSATNAPDVLATPEGGIDLIWHVRLPEGRARIELHVLEKDTELLVRVEGQRRYLMEERPFSDWEAEKLMLRFLQSATA